MILTLNVLMNIFTLSIMTMSMSITMMRDTVSRTMKSIFSQSDQYSCHDCTDDNPYSIMVMMTVTIWHLMDRYPSDIDMDHDMIYDRYIGTKKFLPDTVNVFFSNPSCCYHYQPVRDMENSYQSDKIHRRNFSKDHQDKYKLYNHK